MKTRYLFLFPLLLAAAACDEGIDTTALESTPSKVYLSTSGHVAYPILDFGEATREFELHVNKSGYVDRAATVTFSHDAEAVADYASTNPEALAVLPPSVATFETGKVDMAAGETNAAARLVFDLVAVRARLAAEPDARHVFPVRVSVKGSDVVVNKEKDYLLMDIELVAPRAILQNKEALVETTVDRFRNPSVSELSVPLAITLPFENSGYSFDFTIVADPADLDDYNNRNGTRFEILPSGYTFPRLAIAPGENQCSGNIKIALADLPALVGGKTYLLPVRVTGSGNEEIPVEENSRCYIKLKLAARWSGAWKNTIHAGESGLATSPGYTYDTYLYSRADALEAFTDFTIVSALEVITDEEAVVCPGWAGTMFEQCSPIIKITDGDAGNGKKIVKILAGWAREGAGWEPVTTDNNNSVYDPVTNEIYLDYTGAFSWGNYRIQRTFSSQVPFE
ncbi:MAG: DUF1735 domain-containing protein [Odoribacteraceae bacterium]|jgi:hypothetical protein|nr:DUF1735 domain-containing protein [Odoribacteraceae bacterium]